LQQFQFYDKYSRWDWDKMRRETWTETVDRAVRYMRDLSGDRLDPQVYREIHGAILRMEVMPSMRLLSMAGPAAERNSLAIYNCSAIAVNSIDAFVETMILSMSGAGVGFSVEKMWVGRLPVIQRQLGFPAPIFVVPDSTAGWGEAVRGGLSAWFSGHDLEFDVSGLRPKGAILRVKGGRSSGPEVLVSLLANLRRVVLSRQGQKLRPIDAHDLQCYVGDAAVSGGLRRTAMISIFDWDDEEMLHSKDPGNLAGNEQRWNANNSAVWPEGITRSDVDYQMRSMDRAGSGEPGIFSRAAAFATLSSRRLPADFIPNPCGEILLRPDGGLCNLSSVIARATDSKATLEGKVRVATIIGSIQSMATKFPSLRPEWKRNAEEERLLGVDINGQMDCPAFRDSETMRSLRDHAIGVNAEYAYKLEINQSTAVTCSKPNGNSSTLVDCSPGLHARYGTHIIRRARVAATSPVFRVLQASGVPLSPENGQTPDDARTWVVSFPVKAPEGSVTRHDLTAIQQCDYWLGVKENWTEHNPSCTIGYGPDELDDLIEWVWEHRDKIGGLSFLPNSQTAYQQAPYEEISENEFNQLTAAFPNIDYSLLPFFEKADHTTSSMEIACAGGACLIG